MPRHLLPKRMGFQASGLWIAIKTHAPVPAKMFGSKGPDENGIAIDMNDDVGLALLGGGDLHDLLRDPTAHRRAERRDVDVAARQTQQPPPARRRHRHAPKPPRKNILLRYEPPARGSQRCKQRQVGAGHDHAMLHALRHEALRAFAHQAAGFEIPRERKGHQFICRHFNPLSPCCPCFRFDRFAARRNRRRLREPIRMLQHLRDLGDMHSKRGIQLARAILVNSRC